VLLKLRAHDAPPQQPGLAVARPTARAWPAAAARKLQGGGARGRRQAPRELRRGQSVQQRSKAPWSQLAAAMA